MLEKHQRGDDPGFEEFMEKFGDFFPENPQNVDELLEQMARRMAAMQAMMNSMTPEQRAQLQQLSDQLLEDMDLQWQMQQLSGNLQQMFPQMNWNQSYDFEGQDPMGFGQAMQAMQDLGDLDQLENLLRNASSPGALAEADMDRVRDLMGDDAAKSLERLAELTKMLEEAGLIEQKEGRLELTPKGLRAIGSNALRDLFSKLAKDKIGQHETNQLGPGPRAHLRHQAVRVRRPVPARPAPHDPQRAAAHGRRHAGDPRPRRLRDRAHRAPHPLVDGADARPVAVDADARQLPAGQEGGDGAAPPDHVAVPARLPGHRRVLRNGPRAHRRTAARGVVGLRVRHEHAPRRSCSPASCSPARPGTKQIIMITDGEPTAHITPSGESFFNYPPVRETVEATLREVVRCTKEQIRINTFVLGADGSLRAFIETDDEDQPGPGVLHDPRDARRLRARRLHRGQASAVARSARRAG